MEKQEVADALVQLLTKAELSEHKPARYKREVETKAIHIVGVLDPSHSDYELLYVFVKMKPNDPREPRTVGVMLFAPCYRDNETLVWESKMLRNEDHALAIEWVYARDGYWAGHAIKEARKLRKEISIKLMDGKTLDDLELLQDTDADRA